MNKLEEVQAKVHGLYASKDPNRDEWTDWVYDNHVLIVARYARELAKKYGANEELSEVAALLHDVADVKMARVNPNHEEVSLEIARQVMTEAGFTADEISLVVDDAIRYHSCHEGKKPKSTEGLVLATADSLAHLKTDFYVHAAWSFGKTRSLEVLKDWAVKKLERDLYVKISFEDERRDATPDYEAIKRLFSR
jgi:putative nucleotidyltransferase with HDIG domain